MTPHYLPERSASNGGVSPVSRWGSWKMGLLSDYHRAEYEGNTIEVEARTTNLFSGSFQYSLIINNDKTDQIDGSLGHFTLRGRVPDGRGEMRPVVIRIKQGLFGAKYKLEVAGAEYTLTKVY